MQQRKLFIKGMVCDRCMNFVRQAMESLDVVVQEVKLGEVILSSHEGPDESVIETKLNSLGFSLVKDKQQQLVRLTKELVAEVYSGEYDFPYQFRFSDLLVQRLELNYDQISATFSQVEGITLEKYILQQRVEKVKEMLIYSQVSLTDISFMLGFSSVAHLSKQFKNLTGINPSQLKAKNLIHQPA
ncbi:MAG TPA: helix-turn-helix domain-containing protein [Chitinophagaceae bacterium]|nr:helix-turn-helix domain-containing protein [Chitinophagaceae bacterium]